MKKMKNKLSVLYFIALTIIYYGCKSSVPKEGSQTGNTAETASMASNVPPVNAGTIYQYTKMQVDFGPRVPGTAAHEKCLDFIMDILKRDSMNPTVQKAPSRTYTGKNFEMENIIASYDPKNLIRIMLCAHWDTRPFADQDTVDSDQPFDGADDGACGVGMMLDVADVLHHTPPGIGVDFVFFDLEDYGQENDDTEYPHQANTWCLGSQYWSKNLPVDYITPRYGILLDMVGGKNAVFPMEGVSLKYDFRDVDRIWGMAERLGYGNYFTRDRIESGITDDHLYINQIAHIPTIDVVNYEIQNNNFPSFHHTHGDNLSIIDTNTIHAVGTVLLNVIYSEKNNGSMP